jgi:hypothetical protein
MKKYLERIPFHAFLVGLYIIFFIFVRNLREVTLAMTYRSVAISLLVSGLLFAIAYFFFRSSRKAGIYTTLLIIGFFVYGFIYSQLESLFYKGLWPFSHIHRFLIIAYCIAFLAVFLLLLRSPRPHFHVNYNLNLFVLVLLGANAIMAFAAGRPAHTRQPENPFIQAFGAQGPDTGMTSSRPDVYYIVLDGYAAEDILKRDYEVAEPSFYQYLRRAGFYIADSSRANYPFTSLSLACSLNMNYLDSIDKKINYPLIEKNLVSHVFKQAGYRYVNIGSGYAVTENQAYADKTIPTPGLNEFENRLLELTILRLDDVLGFTGFKRLKGQLQNVSQMVAEPGPKYCFVHVVAPHPPFVVDSAGNQKFRSSLSDMAWEPRSDYLGQLQYVSRKIAAFIDSIKSRPGVPPVILVQSDHGPWINEGVPRSVYEARSHILNAFYVPDSIRQQLYPTITPANSFRLLFRNLLHLNLSPLPDRPFQFETFQSDPTFKKYAD